MSLRRTCDGCGARGVDLTERGIVRKLEFCETCLPVVDAYCQALDNAHEQCASLWRDLKAQAEIRARNQGVGELPL